MNKQICDECGIEIKNSINFSQTKYAIWGTFPYGWENLDFCSLKCLIKYIDKIKEKESK